jgi:heme/copper-type cytochrome/quinol oxidase subunit 2
METLKINSEKNLRKRKRVLKADIFSLLFMMLFAVQSMAEVSMAEAKEKAAHSEFMSYIAMGVGFALVMFIAIYTSFKKKKNKNADDKHEPIPPQPFKHNYHHERRGTHQRRR